MKKIKYIQIGIRNILFLLVISCAFAAAYGLTALPLESSVKTTIYLI
jgi:hypothetical protein